VISNGASSPISKKIKIKVGRKDCPPKSDNQIRTDSLYEMGLGVKSIGVARKTWQAQPLKEAGASAIISSLDQLDQLL